MAALAQMELEIKRERVTDSVSKRLAAGENLGGRKLQFSLSQIQKAQRLIDAGESATQVATVDADGRVREATTTGSAQTYAYDDRDRLTKVEDTIADSCSTRVYGFSGDSDRTSLANYGPGTGGVCQTATVSSTITSSFDAADRLTTSGYVYDELGRTKTLPAAHTSNTAGGALSVGYHANDIVATLSQSVIEDGVTATKAQDFTLDVAGRLSVTKNLTDTVSLVESTNHYYGTDDSPAWTTPKPVPTRPPPGRLNNLPTRRPAMATPHRRIRRDRGEPRAPYRPQ